VLEVTAAATESSALFEPEVSNVRETWTAVAAAATGVCCVLDCFRKERARTEAEHLERLQEAIRVEVAEVTKPRRRGRAQQFLRRSLAKAVRREAVACYQALQERGYTLAECAELLNVSPRRLRHWDQHRRPEPLLVVPLGRPAARSEPARRGRVLDFLKEKGPGVGVPTLQQQFPDLARAELTDLLQRYRRVVCGRWHESARVLHWQVAGRVWSMDFAEPSRLGEACSLPPIDGVYPYLLAVRDLASGFQLGWLPVGDATAERTMAILARLFAEYGAPLVLKSDNGPAFRAFEMKKFLDQAGVYPLFSPPYWPGYNGAIEAAIGSLKRRTEQHAASAGHTGLWTSTDVEAARQQANAMPRRRLKGRRPAAVWAERGVITDVERVRFELAVEAQRFVARTEKGIAPEIELDHWTRSAVDRKAMERALVEHDYLLFRGRRVPLTIQPGKVTVLV